MPGYDGRLIVSGSRREAMTTTGHAPALVDQRVSPADRRANPPRMGTYFCKSHPPIRFPVTA